MLLLEIPHYRTLRLEHLVLDYNGTLAVDGELLLGIADLLNQLSEQLQIHVVTADTFGVAQRNLTDVNCKVTILTGGKQDAQKQAYVLRLGAHRTACIGNGRNDRLMLKKAALSICVLLAEGASAETLRLADIVCTSIRDALELLSSPRRLTATLRNG